MIRRKPDPNFSRNDYFSPMANRLQFNNNLYGVILMKKLLLNLTLIFVCGISLATDRYVSLTGTNDAAGGYTNWEGAATQIQWAVNVAVSGDTVWVAGGPYEAGTTNIGGINNRVAITNAITVRSADNNPAQTIIKGGTDIRGVYISSANAWLIGFTVTNGRLNNINGGGVYGGLISNCIVTGNSATNGGGAGYVTAYNCTFSGNSAFSLGGGAYYGTLFNCMLTSNSAVSGGGTAHTTTYHCKFVRNLVSSAGGGSWYGTHSNGTFSGNSASQGGATYAGTFYDCLFVGNAATGSANGGGGVLYGTALYNCTLVGNSANQGGGVTASKLINCISWSNNCRDSLVAGSVYSCGVGYTNGGSLFGNITNNPLFIADGAGYGTNHVAGDYRLRNNSPCVDTGTNQEWMANTIDLDWHRRIDLLRSQVDMGCYERISKGAVFTLR